MGGPGSGGARSRSGPPRTRGALRRGNAGDDLMHLDPAGRQDDPPAWPLSRPVRFELETWAREWRRPQAIAWERLGWEVQVALYVRTLRQASSPKASAGTTTNLLRQMVNLGLTEDGMARNRWAIAPSPTASGQVRPAVVTGPTGWRALVLPVLGGLAFGAYLLMLIVGKSPWQ